MSNNQIGTADAIGTIYLLHFDNPFHHCRHYVGWTSLSVEKRLERHVAGQGSRLVRAAIRAGISVIVAKTWAGTRHDERIFKQRNSTPQHCPFCKKATLARKASSARARRAETKAMAAMAAVA